MELAGRQLKINHPTGYRPSDPPTMPLRAPPEILQQYRVATLSSPSSRPAVVMPTIITEAERRADRKQRELFVGNLVAGSVNSQMLELLFSEPLRTIPGNEAHPVPPVVEAKVDPGGKFGFVEFRDGAMCEVALHLFNGMMLCGQPMVVARPAGRVVPPDPADACKQGSEGAASQVPASSSTGATGASKVVCLTNLLSEKALASDVEFAECVHDIRAECEQFGRVEAFVVPRERALEGRPASDVGKCFIAYEDEPSAARAVESLHNRQFDGLTVQATFLPASWV